MLLKVQVRIDFTPERRFKFKLNLCLIDLKSLWRKCSCEQVQGEDQQVFINNRAFQYKVYRYLCLHTSAFPMVVVIRIRRFLNVSRAHPGPGVVCGMRSGHEDCVRRQPTQDPPGVDHLCPLPHHHPPSTGQQDSTGLVSDGERGALVDPEGDQLPKFKSQGDICYFWLGGKYH